MHFILTPRSKASQYYDWFGQRRLLSPSPGSWPTRANPPRTYAPERSLPKMVSPVVSVISHHPHLMHLYLVILDLLISVTVRLISTVTFQSLVCPQFTSFPIKQTDDYHSPRSEAVLGGEWNESVDIYTYGRMLSFCFSRKLKCTYLAGAFARFSRCLPDARCLDLCHRRGIMLQNLSMFCFIKWSSSAASFSKLTSFGVAHVAWTIFN